MEVQVKGKGIVVTEALHDYAVKRIGKLEKHFHNLHKATVTQTVQGRLHRVEVQLEGDGVIMRGEDHHGDLYEAMDRVVDKLERRMQKFRDRRRFFGAHPHHGDHDSIRKFPLKEDPNAVAVGEDLSEKHGKIVRQKEFAIKPLSAEDAILEMELLSHDFFVFQNADSSQVNVLYRREDGNYGILVPEY
jgi:putative sigma-54 modulation protein